MSDSERVSLRYLEHAGQPSIALVTLERGPVNAIDEPMKRDLIAIAHELAHRPDLGAVVLTGMPAFSAGDDIKEMAQVGRDHALRGRELISEVCTAIAQLPVPVIAAVVGLAMGGGCELALAADFRITADDARWGLPEILLGLVPGGGGTQRLPRLVGTARAKRMIYLGEIVTGRTAAEFGLADEAIAADEVLPRALELAEQLTRQAPLALRAAKLAIDRGVEQDLGAALAFESSLFAGIFSTRDADLGLQSFVMDGPGKATFSGH